MGTEETVLALPTAELLPVLYHVFLSGVMSADSDNDDEGLPLSQAEEDDLIDNGFVMNRTMDHATDAAAQESLIRILEAGPCVLEGVKEAAGALKVILAGEVTPTCGAAC